VGSIPTPDTLARAHSGAGAGIRRARPPLRGAGAGSIPNSGTIRSLRADTGITHATGPMRGPSAGSIPTESRERPFDFQREHLPVGARSLVHRTKMAPRGCICRFLRRWEII
jgi:hypothetical protein